MTVDPLGYPFTATDESFELGAGPRGEVAVLAYGANGSPEVLRRKLGDDVCLHAVAGTLDGFDVVYSAHISPYGAIPATLHAAPGRSIRAWTLFLTDEQLERLATTEPNYDLREVGGVLAFVSKHGALAGPVRLADATQREVQDMIRRRFAPDETLERFIERNRSDPTRAAGITAVLRGEGVPFV